MPRPKNCIMPRTLTCWLWLGIAWRHIWLSTTVIVCRGANEFRCGDGETTSFHQHARCQADGRGPSVCGDERLPVLGNDRALHNEPVVTPPIRVEYGLNIKLGMRVRLAHGTTFIDSCPVSIGDDTLIEPNCSFYSGSHPIDPALRNGLRGPEDGRRITIGQNCWIGGGSIIVPGVAVGRGCVIDRGSVVTKVRIIVSEANESILT